MSQLGAIAICASASWLFLTIAYQFRPCSKILGRYDSLRLLPRWTFFAPNPATRDGHIIVRDKTAEGEIGEWRTLNLTAARSVFDSVWNPPKRVRKILSDASQSLKRIMHAEKSAIQTSLPYLLILACCLTRQESPSDVVARQFALIETSGWIDRPIWIIFTSEFHPL